MIHLNAFAFYGCKLIEQVSVPYGINALEACFGDCVSLQKIELPESLMFIGLATFLNCAIEEITLPRHLRSIGAQAFWGSKLKHIFIPSDVKEISNQAFACPTLQSVSVDPSNAGYEVNGNCLTEKKTKKAVAVFGDGLIPNDGSVTSIGNGALTLSGIKKAVIPDAVKKIDPDAIRGACIEELTLPRGIEGLLELNLWDCFNLKKIYLPKELVGRANIRCAAEIVEI